LVTRALTNRRALAIERALEQGRLRAEKKRADAEIHALVVQLRERGRELEQANEELDSFSHSVSHDLRSPLRAIDGFARILAEDHRASLGAEGQQAVDVICDRARRMGQLIDALLRFSRLGRQAIRPQEVDMTALAREAVDEARRAAEPGRAIDVRVGDLSPVRGDPELLRQVWLNLVGNAVKFTRTRAPAIIEVASEARDGEVVFSVADNGVGFDPKYAAKLFGVFQRLHGASEFEGTGVGLALVQRIVHRHGGWVRAESTPDEGATFSFALARAETSPERGLCAEP
jgi:light-regulated signal transduction histidine kinase (bacteriophytochrome)